ncbi:MaoC family dehydratase N-terminal domain-containing protein [Streptomyces gardneri]|uniref:fused (3R)-hydroxyacyl-ACP dehydratase subunits HadA/HadB n=1 Tax=Nocardia TaxID=1817 RepID=UPI0013586710|nr:MULTISPECIES: fused (3R)-hydroxyacyl-ACP dehydratase subunits HadA/HadB [Nocardia]MBF6164056.1 MaoC family dehydratase N-terminal domain-containing protein [Streptomyces gardneri]MBF6203632.1 MaoC family dehydratase N-terminal domain-containing protein [Streptomyces gardneri]
MSREQTMARPDVAVAAATPAGQRFRVRDHYEVGREKVREFARAVQNHHAAHQRDGDARALGYPGIIAPPTFASVIGMTGTRALLDSVLTDYDLSQFLQTDQVFEIYRPILAGDRVRSEIVVESIRRFGDNDFIVVRFALSNRHGDVAIVGSTTIVARRGAEADAALNDVVENIMMHGRPAESDTAGATVGSNDALVPLGVGPLVEPHEHENAPVHTLPSFDELAPGDQLPDGSFRLTRGDLANYAGVSGDANPIHFSDHAAQIAGLPTVVAHGMLTMGLAGGYLTAWLGDPTAIRKFSVRFSGFVPVAADAASTVEFTGRIKSLDPGSRTATILLGGSSEGRKLFGRALAEVRLR